MPNSKQGVRLALALSSATAVAAGKTSVALLLGTTFVALRGRSVYQKYPRPVLIQINRIAA